MEWSITQISILSLLLAAVLVALALTWRHLQKKVGPNQALIDYGPKGTTVIVGGTRFVNPITHEYKIFSLELMSFDVSPNQVLYTTQGIAVQVEAVTQIKVQTDDNVHIRAAAEQFLSKPQKDRENLIRLVMEGHLRNIVGHLRVEDLVSNADYVAAQLIAAASPDLDRMGLVIASFTLKDVHDEGDYIANLGRPQVEELRRQAETTTAFINKDMQIQRSNAQREASLACAVADQDSIKADTESKAFQAQAERDLALTRTRLEAEVQQQRITSEQANQIHAQRLEQQVIAEQIKVEEARRTLLLVQARNEADTLRVRGEAEAEVLTHKSSALTAAFGQAIDESKIRQLLSGVFFSADEREESREQQLVEASH